MSADLAVVSLWIWRRDVGSIVEHIEASESLRAGLQSMMDHHSRINESATAKPWYPLSIATYGLEEVLGAVDSLVSFRTTMWEKTRRFEDAFGAKYGGEAVMVNSGSSADLLIAFALHERSGGPLPDGCEVLAPAVTWPTQIWSLLMAGYRVRLVDIDPRTLNFDLDSLSNAIQPNTKAISLVHLMGNPVNMSRVCDLATEHGLVLFEDCCESLGAKWNEQYVGTFGTASAFSFFFSHHITTMEGGMILTRDAAFAERLRLLRAHGWSRNLRNPPAATDGIDPRYTFLNWGFNVRPTELQAAFGLIQLDRVEEFQDWRNRNVARAKARLEPHSSILQLMEVPIGATPAWFALPLRIVGGSIHLRADLTNHLEKNGVETRPIVTGNIARHPAAKVFGDRLQFDALPGADEIHDAGFYIGLYPFDAAEQLDGVFDLIDAYLRTYQP